MLALVAGVALVQAAGGIKGSARIESAAARRNQDGYKGPVFRPQQPIAQQPLPTPQFQPAPQPIQQIQQVQQPAFQPQQLFRPAPLPVAGPGALAPTFSAKRPEQQIVQQQQQAPIVQLQREPEPVQQQEQQQQQQQEAEVDPNAAAQEGAGSALALPANGASALSGPAAAGASEEEANPRPEPYNFSYAFEAGDSATSGSSLREEQQDASGKVTGKQQLASVFKHFAVFQASERV